MRRTRFGWCSATHPRTKNVPEILRLASISSTRSVCGSTREGRDAQCSCPAPPCISVGWKYSSTSTLRTLRISFTFYARLRRLSTRTARSNKTENASKISVSTAFRNDKGAPPRVVVAPDLPKGSSQIQARRSGHPGISAGDSNGSFGPRYGHFLKRCRDAQQIIHSNGLRTGARMRSEEHTSELQSLRH